MDKEIQIGKFRPMVSKQTCSKVNMLDKTAKNGAAQDDMIEMKNNIFNKKRNSIKPLYQTLVIAKPGNEAG